MKKASKNVIYYIMVVLMCTLVIGGCSKSNKDENIIEVINTAAEEGDIDNPEEAEVILEGAEVTLEGTEEVELPSLTYIGHAGVKIKTRDAKVIYIDANYYKGDYSEPADYILITHGHDDHKPYHTIKESEGCVIITHTDALKDGKYETYDFGNISIEAVAAGGNPNHNIKSGVGYIITVDGISIYHAGDTSMIEQMQLLSQREIDYALYPIDGIYNMDAVEATEVANLVAAKNNIPIHEFDKGDIKKSDNFTPEGRLVLEYGQSITLQ